MSRWSFVLLGLLWLAGPSLAQTNLTVGIETVTTKVKERLGDQELLKAAGLTASAQNPLLQRTLGPSFAGTPEERERAKEQFTSVVVLAITQQNRLDFISGFVKQILSSMSNQEPDLDKYLEILQERNPDIDFKDPQVLKVLRGNLARLTNNFAGLAVEPNSLALLALVEPEFAVQVQLYALQTRLADRGTWDPEGNDRLTAQIASLEDALKDQTGPTDQRLIRLQNTLKAQNIPIPSTPAGGRILVDQNFQRLERVLAGKDLPLTLPVVEQDRTGLIYKTFSRLDERIRQLEAIP
ncbi:hypothetical protein [Candidatus Cyanaurora vandensis]|uniref:hypothetical protein n=1 Tax=Candidatus Cyanaurora vandensis TaxID=2714958 RepID=UPI00257EE6E8|nr:hypothetical protein [Candidatus Cyanaurora vandensis]